MRKTKSTIYDWPYIMEVAADVKLNERDQDMLRKGEKWVLFSQEDVSAKGESGYILLRDESTNDVLGFARICATAELAYEKNILEPDHEGYYVHTRNNELTILYYQWCKMKDYRPNSNKGWLRDEDFKAYTKKIGWGSNYISHLEELTWK